MTKITINNKDLIATQNTTWDRMDVTHATENEVAGSRDPGISISTPPGSITFKSCIDCHAALDTGWSYCPYCGRMS
jgi:hypothetical protein